MAENLCRSAIPTRSDGHRQQEDLTAASLDDVQAISSDLLHAQQPVAGDCRRLRSGRRQAAGREVLRRPFRPGRRSIGRRAADPARRREDRRSRDSVPQERTYFAWHAPAYLRRRRGGELDHRVDDPRRRPVVAARTRRWSTTSSSRRGQRRLPIERDRRRLVRDRATARPGARLEQVEAIVTEEICRLAKEGPTAGRAESRQDETGVQFISGLERIGGFGGKADIAQPVQHLPRRSRECSRPTSRAIAR